MGKKKGKGQGPAPPRSSSNSMSEPGNTSTSAPASSVPSNIAQAAAPVTSTPAAVAAVAPVAAVTTPVVLAPKPVVVSSTPVVSQVKSAPFAVTPPVVSIPLSPVAPKSVPVLPKASTPEKGASAATPTLPYAPVKLADLGISKASKDQPPVTPKVDLPKQESFAAKSKIADDKPVDNSQQSPKPKGLEKPPMAAQPKHGDEKKGPPKSPKVQHKSSPKEEHKPVPADKKSNTPETIVPQIDFQLKSPSTAPMPIPAKKEQKGQKSQEEKKTPDSKPEHMLTDFSKIIQPAASFQEELKKLPGKQSSPELKRFSAQAPSSQSKDSANKTGQKDKSTVPQQPETLVMQNIAKEVKTSPIDIQQFKPADLKKSPASPAGLSFESLLGKNVLAKDIIKDTPEKKSDGEKALKIEGKDIPKDINVVKEPVSSPKQQQKSAGKQQINKESTPEKSTAGAQQQDKQSKPTKEPTKNEKTPKVEANAVQVKPEESIFPSLSRPEVTLAPVKVVTPVPALPTKVAEPLSPVVPTESQKERSPLPGTQKTDGNKAKEAKTAKKPEVPKKPSGLKPNKQQTKEGSPKSKIDDPELIPGIVWEVASSKKIELSSSPQQDQSKAGNNKKSDVGASLISSTPAPALTKGDLVPEKIKLSPETPISITVAQTVAKATPVLPVLDQSHVTQPKVTAEPPKTPVLPKKEDNKKEAFKKDEHAGKGKDTAAKKGKNVSKSTTAEEFLKDVKPIEKESSKDLPQEVKPVKVESPVSQEKTAKPVQKQEKTPTKEATVPEKSGRTKSESGNKDEEKKPKDADKKKQTSESSTKQETVTKAEPAKAEKSPVKEEKSEKSDPKKKGKEEVPKAVEKSDVKAESKDQKAVESEAPKDGKSTGKPTQDKNVDKNNKKDKNQTKDTKAPKEDQKPIPPKQDSSSPAKDNNKAPKSKDAEDKNATPPKDLKDKSNVKPNDADKGKKDQAKTPKPQDAKPVQEKTETVPPTDTPPVKDEKKSANKQQQKKTTAPEESKPQTQGKGAKDKKVVEKPAPKEKVTKTENIVPTETEKSPVKDKGDAKKADNKTNTAPQKPKVEKPKAKEETKEKVATESKTASSDKKKAISISEDKDDEYSIDGSTDEATAAKKKRRRKKKNKKPAEGGTDESVEKSKQPDNKDTSSQKKTKESQPGSNKPPINPQGTKTEKAPVKITPPKAEVSAVIPPAVQPKAPAVDPGENKTTEQEQPFDTAQSKKKKNKKKKQGSDGITTEQTGAENDSAGQKKTPFESRLPKMTVNPLAHHLSNCCCICKATSGNNQMPLQTCTACSLACYCSREHQVQHWTDHKDFCNYISNVLSKDRPYFFTPAEILSPDDRRHFKLSELQVCQKALNRSLTPLESALILHPRACFTCYKPAFQNVCPGCHCINYCCNEHLPPSHQEWCSTFYIKLLFVQSQAKHGSAGVSAPRPSKIYYPLNSNMKEYLESLDFVPPNSMPKELYVSHVSELATYPLTLLHALQLLATQGATNPLDYEHLVVHVVGAEDVYECCQISKWKYFFVNLLPNLKTLHLVFIGCELTIEDERVHVEGRLVYEFHAKMTYLDYCKKCYIKPSIVCAFNSGLYRNTGFEGNDSWGPSLSPMLSMNPGAPVLLTAYTHMEANLDLQRLKEIFLNSLQLVQLPLKNPYASTFPNHNLVSEHECPVAFRNFYLTIVRHT